MRLRPLRLMAVAVHIGSCDGCCACGRSDAETASAGALSGCWFASLTALAVVAVLEALTARCSFGSFGGSYAVTRLHASCACEQPWLPREMRWARRSPYREI